MEEVLSFVVPGLPPSVNNLFATVRRRGRVLRVKTKDYRDYESAVLKHVLSVVSIAKGRQLAGRPYRLQICLVRPAWLTKAGDSYRKPDTPNCIKSVEDAICAVLGWDDGFNVDTRIWKRTQPGCEDHTEVVFSFLASKAANV